MRLRLAIREASDAQAASELADEAAREEKARWLRPSRQRLCAGADVQPQVWTYERVRGHGLVWTLGLELAS